MYWVFLVLNTIPAILFSVLGIPYNYYALINKDPMKADSFRKALIAVNVLTSCLTCITLFVLMLSVYKIRKFYKEHKLIQELNTELLVIHFFAFAGCTLSSMFNFITFVLDQNYSQSEATNVLFSASEYISVATLVVT